MYSSLWLFKNEPAYMNSQHFFGLLGSWRDEQKKPTLFACFLIIQLQDQNSLSPQCLWKFSFLIDLIHCSIDKQSYSTRGISGRQILAQHSQGQSSSPMSIYLLFNLCQLNGFFSPSSQFSHLIIINSRVLSVCCQTDAKHGSLDALHKQRSLSDSLGILIISLLLW